MKSTINQRLLKIGFLVLIAFCLSTTALAQKKKKRVDRVIRLGVTTIEGRVQKPNAFFINTRQALVYEGTTIKESFVTEISKAVKNGML